MVAVLIVTHYSLGDSYRQIMKHFFGENILENLVIGSHQLDTKDSLLPKIKTAIDNIPEHQSILILTDVFGATPCNVLNHIRNHRPISIVTGANVPMIVKALQDAAKYSDVAQFAKEVVKTAKDGIITYNLSQRVYVKERC